MDNISNKLYPRKTWLRVLLMALPIIVILVALSSVVANNSNGNNIGYQPVIAVVDEPTQREQEPEPPLAIYYQPPNISPFETLRWEYPEDDVIIDPRPRAWLTGLPIYEEYLDRRPIAVVINNLRDAQPQSGIASADIIYEVLSEGDITRLVGIFQSEVPDKIGPVRSARDSFIDFAFNHDALFVHHGRSPDADARLRSTRITNLDGMSLGAVFWRDRTYPYWHRNSGTRALEHSSYTSRERIATHLYSRGIREYINDNPGYGFVFGIVPPYTNAGVAEVVTVPFSTPYTRTFIFDRDIGLYLVENRDGPHQDAETREQVAVTNILIQITTKRVTGTLGQRTIGTVGEGDGFFVTGGQYRPVRWAKDSHVSPMRWYFMDGSPLVLSPGVTWICVFQTTGTVSFEAAVE